MQWSIKWLIGAWEGAGAPSFNRIMKYDSAVSYRRVGG